jgi:hypothetical protein
MKPIARFTALALVVALSLAAAPRSGNAGTPTTPNAKTCYFVRNNLPCPCPGSRQARAVATAARVTVGALGHAMGTTATALARTHSAAKPAGH